MPEMNNEYWDLVDRLVPNHGTADTIQGELVRAVLRLTAECCRNGCGNWDNYFETLTQFALDKFSDGTLDASLTERSQTILERLRRYGRSVGDPEAGDLNQPFVPVITKSEKEAIYSELCRDIDEPLEKAAAQWCLLHPTLIPFMPRSDYGALD